MKSKTANTNIKGRRPFNSIKKCVLCLSKVGFGGRTIERLTNTNRSLVGRWIKKSGLLRLYVSTKPYKTRPNFVSKKTQHLSDPNILIANGYRTDAAFLKKQDKMWLKHPAVISFKRKQRYNTDAQFKMKEVLRLRAGKFIKRKFNALRKIKTIHTSELIGCSRQQLMLYIQSQFKHGMNWNNHGKVWHIDHIRPIASFNLLEESEQRKCFHFSNLQPLFKQDNANKSDKIIPHQPELLIDIRPNPKNHPDNLNINR